MEESTGKIKFFPDGEIPKGFLPLSDDEMKLMENMKEQIEPMIQAWNVYISKRKVSTIEKIKMRQSWIASWNIAWRQAMGDFGAGQGY